MCDIEVGEVREAVGAYTLQGFIQDFSKRGGNHLTPPTYQETVPITNALTARNTPLEKILGVFEQLHTFLLQQLSFCCCLCFKTTLL